MKRKFCFATSIKLKSLAYIVRVLASEILSAFKVLFGKEVSQAYYIQIEYLNVDECPA
ncbi:MAG TPA: hypothetical protein VF682_20710 [Pseudomonas sp.]|jgi:hypothetical protein